MEAGKLTLSNFLKISIQTSLFRILHVQSSPTSLVHPWAVTVMEDYVYWTDWSQAHSTIFRNNKKVGGKEELLNTIHMVNNINFIS